MRWSEPQQAMLQAMGLRLWLPPAVAAAGLPTTEPASGAAAAYAAAPGPAAPSPATATAPRPAQPASAAAAAPQRPALPLASAATTAAATMDWPSLRSAVADCRACGLCDSRRQTVFGVGHLRAHCMVVGEAPGEQEDACGEPFVGESGQLLDRMLRALGLSRNPATAPGGPAQTPAEAPLDDPAHQVYIANTLKCRPPRNRNPSLQELATCQPFLQRQVALVQPRVILAMGRFAVQSLLGSDEPIGRLRGRLHSWHGVPLVVTYHPAYLLRQPADKAKAWDDLCLAASVLGQAPG